MPIVHRGISDCDSGCADGIISPLYARHGEARFELDVHHRENIKAVAPDRLRTRTNPILAGARTLFAPAVHLAKCTMSLSEVHRILSRVFIPSLTLLLIPLVQPSFAQEQPDSHILGDQVATALGISMDHLIDAIGWVGFIITILICYKGGAFGGPGKAADKK